MDDYAVTLVLCQCYRIHFLKGVLTVPMLRARLWLCSDRQQNSDLFLFSFFLFLESDVSKLHPYVVR